MMFVVSKIMWIFFAPSSLLVILLLVGAFLAVAQRESLRIVGRRICFGVAMLFFLVAIFPIGNWMLVPLENRFPPAKLDHVDGIIMVGEDENPEIAAARGQSGSSFASNDYIVFAGLSRQFPQAKLVYTGGSGLITPDSDIDAGEIARDNFIAMGLPVDHIVFENKSRTTYENAKFTSDKVKPDKQQKWLIVTSAMHMPRTIATFRKAGWTVYAAPAAYLTDGAFSTKLNFALDYHLMEMRVAVHEYVGLLTYRLEGYTSEIWPK